MITLGLQCRLLHPIVAVLYECCRRGWFKHQNGGVHPRLLVDVMVLSVNKDDYWTKSSMYQQYVLFEYYWYMYCIWQLLLVCPLQLPQIQLVYMKSMSFELKVHVLYIAMY